MKIANYSVQQQSTHQLDKRKEVAEKLEAWRGNRNANQEEPSFLLDISSSRQVFEFNTEKSYLNGTESAEDTGDHEFNAKLLLLESFIYMTTGRRVHLNSPEIDLDQSQPTAVSFSGGGPAGPRDNWGLVYEYHEVSSENESLNFHSAGSVTTADGKSIAFDLEFNMSRSFYQENNVSLRFGNAAKVDPLIINLKGGAPELTRTKQAFDLNADGMEENISFATGGSGFLALDKNGDGVINDGSELFGPESGDGFTDLRAYDLDKNGWIDESDDVFGKLSILVASEDGEKTLFKLGEAGVGAIYLNDISTQFDIKDGLGAYGEMKSSSIYLKEDGTAGTIHHVDLTV
jgi:hypothetical protein